VLASLLRLKQRLADGIPHILMEGGKILLGVANLKDRLDLGRNGHAPIMPKLA